MSRDKRLDAPKQGRPFGRSKYDGIVGVRSQADKSGYGRHLAYCYSCRGGHRWEEECNGPRASTT